MIDSPPFLRAPPFPWVAPRNARISEHRDDQPSPGETHSIAIILTELEAAKVGGTFWGRKWSGGFTTILRPSRSNLEPYLRLATAPAGRAVALFDEPPAPAISAALSAHDIALLWGIFDPWSALGPGITLLADLDDEWTLVAALARADTPLHRPDALRDKLTSAVSTGVRYRDCFTGQPTSPCRAIEIAGEWRRATDRTASIVVATGIAWWKKPAIERFLWLGNSRYPAILPETATALDEAARADGAIAVWPSRAPQGLVAGAATGGVALVAVEDGFIRSVGLGAGLHPPSSIIVDGRGIYYDPNRPSDLEYILENHEFSPEMVGRAGRLRERIVAYGISKYASDASVPAPPRRDRRTVLVAGQVEDDQSVRAGGAGIAGNLDLLQRARVLEPDAHILFKPHPDVDAGHRVGKVPDADLLAQADEIVRGESMAALLSRVDAVHVLTSLTGFEALLRGLEVTTHGQPFYAGWGLTRDLAGLLPRRTRRLTLDELVAGALLLYPLYLDPETQLPCPAEVLLERFRHRRKPRPTPITLVRAIQGRIAKLFGTTTD